MRRVSLTSAMLFAATPALATGVVIKDFVGTVAVVEGAADVEIGADVVDAEVDASGVGGVQLGTVSETYSERVSGMVEVRRG